MGIQVMTNVRPFVAGSDLTGPTNKAALNVSREALESTTFGSNGAREFLGGLQGGAFNLEGFADYFDAARSGQLAWATLGAVTPFTLVPSGVVAEDVTSLAFLGTVLPDAAIMEGAAGQLAPYKLGGNLTGPLVMGSVIATPGTARGASSSTTALQLGAVSSALRMWCNLHVVSIAGTGTPTITAKLQSSPTAGGAYVDRITFAAATVVSGQAGSVAGAITDTWWKLTYTISGTSPSFLIAASAGIAAR